MEASSEGWVEFDDPTKPSQEKEQAAVPLEAATECGGVIVDANISVAEGKQKRRGAEKKNSFPSVYSVDLFFLFPHILTIVLAILSLSLSNSLLLALAAVFLSDIFFTKDLYRAASARVRGEDHGEDKNLAR